MMQLQQVAEVTNAVLSGADGLITGVSIDSRSLREGDLFVAIKGQHLDGHHFIGAARRSGAVAAIVSLDADVSASEPGFSMLKVRDTTEALGQLAAHWRQQFSLPVIGITGSNGKTTVTAMVRQILSSCHQPLAPKQSFNNQWGVPLTLLELHSGHTHAVIEMGMNHRGEIDYLTRIAQPTVALINNAAAAHLEGLGSVREVALAKAEIINGLKTDGVLVINDDDDYRSLWRDLTPDRDVIGFGFNPEARVSAQRVKYGPDSSEFELVADGQRQPLRLPVAGKHNIYNALAAASVCHAAGVGLEQVCAGLATFEPVQGRQRRLRTAAGAQLIDDSFNANPASVAAAIDVLGAQQGKTVLVLGTMAELGQKAHDLHRQVGVMARQAAIDRLLVLTDSGDPAASGYRDGFGDSAESFSSLDNLIDALQEDDHAGVSILVKGSKSSRMGRVADQLLGNAAPSADSSGSTTKNKTTEEATC